MMDEWSQGFIGDPGPLAHKLTPLLEAGILEFVVDGFRLWESRGFVRFGDEENHFTAPLVGCLREVRRMRNLSFFARREQVEDDPEILAGRADPDRAARIDISVWWASTEDTYFTVECKRLTPGVLTQWYVAEGMMRFIKGRYAGSLPSAAMLGYIVDGDSATLWGEINSRIDQIAELHTDDYLQPRANVGGLDTVYESKHRRQAPLTDIRLTHLFVDMTTRPPLVSQVQVSVQVPTADSGRTSATLKCSELSRRRFAEVRPESVQVLTSF